MAALPAGRRWPVLLLALFTCRAALAQLPLCASQCPAGFFTDFDTCVDTQLYTNNFPSFTGCTYPDVSSGPNMVQFGSQQTDQNGVHYNITPGKYCYRAACLGPDNRVWVCGSTSGRDYGTPVAMGATITLGNYTTSTFDATAAAALRTYLAVTMGTNPGAVNLTSVTNVPTTWLTGRRHMQRRALLQMTPATPSTASPQQYCPSVCAAAGLNNVLGASDPCWVTNANITNFGMQQQLTASGPHSCWVQPQALGPGMSQIGFNNGTYGSFSYTYNVACAGPNGKVVLCMSSVLTPSSGFFSGTGVAVSFTVLTLSAKSSKFENSLTSAVPVVKTNQLWSSPTTITGLNSTTIAYLTSTPSVAPFYPTYIVSSAATLQGYNTSSFDACTQDTFNTFLADLLNIPETALQLTSRANGGGGGAGHRRLMQTPSLVVGFSASTHDGQGLAAAISTGAGVSGQALQAAGLTGCTGLSFSGQVNITAVQAPPSSSAVAASAAHSVVLLAAALAAMLAAA